MLTSHAQTLRDLLLQSRPLWTVAVPELPEDYSRSIPEDWYQYGRERPFPEQYRLSQGFPDPSAPPALNEWVSRAHHACALPERSLPSEILHADGLTPKKRHEVAALLGFFQEERIHPSRVVDIGGGMGHLARHLALALRCPVDSLDRDLTLQAKGRRFLKRPPWTAAASQLRFLSGQFPADFQLPAEKDVWAIGLHTCGRLAWSCLELACKGYSLVNFGCCYEALTLPEDAPRSRFFRENLLPLTRESLFLANRGGVKRSEAEFHFQQRVLTYRYTLHLLLGLSDAGSASREIYLGGFAGYARDRAGEALRDRSDAELEDFLRASAPQVERMRFQAFLRAQLARPVELALLLDRALWLQEQLPSARIQLTRFFDPGQSPRNVGIIVQPGG